MIPLDTLEDHARVLRYRVVSKTATLAIFADEAEARAYAMGYAVYAPSEVQRAGLRVVDDVLRKNVKL